MEEEVSAGKHLLFSVERFLFEVASPDSVPSVRVRGATLSHPLIRQSGLVGIGGKQTTHSSHRGGCLSLSCLSNRHTGNTVTGIQRFLFPPSTVCLFLKLCCSLPGLSVSFLPHQLPSHPAGGQTGTGFHL